MSKLIDLYTQDLCLSLCKLDLNFIKKKKFREKLQSSVYDRILRGIKDPRLYNVDINNNIMEKGQFLFVTWKKM